MKDDIDTLLRDWAARRAPDDRRLAALEDRILGAFGRANAAARSRYGSWRHAVAWFAAGVAATVVAACLFRSHGVRGPQPERDPWAALLTEENGLFAARRPAVARVFSETERLFGSNLLWIAQSGHEVELGVSDDPLASDSLEVRITLVARTAGSDEWKRVWKTELVARTDDVLELPSLGGARSRVAIWMHRLDPCSVLVESRLTLQEAPGLAAEASEVLRFGATRSVTRFRHGDTEYHVLQTVAPVGGGACSS